MGLERQGEEKAFRQRKAHVQRLGVMKEDCVSGVAGAYMGGVGGWEIRMKSGLRQFMEHLFGYNEDFMTYSLN